MPHLYYISLTLIVWLSRRHYLRKDFYKIYPEILRTMTAELGHSNTLHPDMNLLLTNLSFSHFIELLKVASETKRKFYELYTIKNNWVVRDLKRAIDSMLYERTGLSADKQVVLQKHQSDHKLQPEDVFRNTYLLEFLGLEEKPSYTESDLEESIITHLQNFLLEMGCGFCFEARQRRITFDNKYYRIDLVFFHRILKCHILLDLKLGEFSHSDAGQMNVYLNYYKKMKWRTAITLP